MVGKGGVKTHKSYQTKNIVRGYIEGRLIIKFLMRGIYKLYVVHTTSAAIIATGSHD